MKCRPSALSQADTISVDFPDEDVRVIIRNVADLFGVSTSLSHRSLTGRVSLKLRDVTWPQLFQVILEPLNYTYITDRNIILIRNRNGFCKSLLDTRRICREFLAGRRNPRFHCPLGRRRPPEAGSKWIAAATPLVITERPSRFNGIQTDHRDARPGRLKQVHD